MSQEFFALLKIPQELFEEIQQYTISRDYYYFVSTCKSLESIKLDTAQITLTTRDLTELFADDNEVTLQGKIKKIPIYQRITHPERQLKVNFSTTFLSKDIREKLLSLEMNTLKAVDLKLQDFPNWKTKIKAKTLILRGYIGTNDFHGFPGKLHLFLSPFYPLVEPSIASQNIPNLYELNFLKSSLHDFNCFHHVSILYLSSCFHLEDVSGLGNIAELWISNCPNLRDISALQNNRKLTILSCSNIDSMTISFENIVFLYTDVFPCITSLQQPSRMKKIMFTKLKKLTLQTFNNPFLLQEIISHAPSLRSLTVEGPNSPDSHLIPMILPVPNSSRFDQIHELVLDGCFVDSYHGLEQVPLVRLMDCSFKKDDNVFPPYWTRKNKTVELIRCRGVKDFSFFNGISRLLISACDCFQNAEQVKDVKYLTLLHCHSVMDISCLGNVKFLSLAYCPLITSFIGLGKVKEFEYFTYLCKKSPILQFDPPELIQTENFRVKGLLSASINFFPVHQYLIVNHNQNHDNELIYLKNRSNPLLNTRHKRLSLMKSCVLQ